jgi:hypothetical protein
VCINNEEAYTEIWDIVCYSILCALQSIKKFDVVFFCIRIINYLKIMRYFQTFFWRNSCLILDSQTIDQFISSRTKWHSPCFKMVKKSGRYLLLYESNKEFKIASYFSITLYIERRSVENFELQNELFFTLVWWISPWNVMV